MSTFTISLQLLYQVRNYTSPIKLNYNYLPKRTLCIRELVQDRTSSNGVFQKAEGAEQQRGRGQGSQETLTLSGETRGAQQPVPTEWDSRGSGTPCRFQFCQKANLG